MQSLFRLELILGLVLASSPRADEAAVLRGEKVFQYCFACHSVQLGETHLQGPNLRGIVGRPIASAPGFEYSRAFQAFAQREGRWTVALLDRYIAAPQEVVPKTAMAFGGVEDRDERAALIIYLLAADKTIIDDRKAR
jgi:cytochrome c